MESQPAEEKRSKPWARTMALCVAAALLAIWSVHFFSFFRVCMDYTRQSLQGPESIPIPVIPEEAIVVLTGNAKRIPKAIELLRSRDSSFLLISGTAKRTTLTALVNEQGDAATHIHEVWPKILLESQSSSTIENAVESGKVLKEKNVRRVILVTSDYHMLRSSLIFKTVLPQYEYLQYPVSSVLAELSWTPNRSTIDAIWRIFVEYWKYLLFTTYLIHHVGP